MKPSRKVTLMTDVDIPEHLLPLFVLGVQKVGAQLNMDIDVFTSDDKPATDPVIPVHWWGVEDLRKPEGVDG